MTTRKTVGEIAAEMPGAVRVFEKYDIDYCCGGKRPLDDVCRERGLSAEAIVAEMAAGPANGDAKDWSKARLADLISHIVSTHHEYLKIELPLIQARLAKVIEVHGRNHGDSLLPLASHFEGLHEELDAHLRKEEMILFPAIEALERARSEGRAPVPPPFGTVNNPIRMMVFEHDSAGNALGQMRAVTQNYTLPPEACRMYTALFQGLEELEADLHRHIHLENNILFPRAVSLEAGQ